MVWRHHGLQLPTLCSVPAALAPPGGRGALHRRAASRCTPQPRPPPRWVPAPARLQTRKFAVPYVLAYQAIQSREPSCWCLSWHSSEAPGCGLSVQTTSVRGMYRQAAAIPGATLGERVSGALLVPPLDVRQRQEVQEVQRRRELQKGHEVEGVGARALTPASEGERVRAQTAGEFAQGQRGRLFELLQLLGKVLGEDVHLAAVGLALAGHAVIPPCPRAGSPRRGRVPGRQGCGPRGA